MIIPLPEERLRGTAVVKELPRKGLVPKNPARLKNQ
jgi:hypothetical protein